MNPSHTFDWETEVAQVDAACEQARAVLEDAERQRRELAEAEADVARRLEEIG